MMKTQRLVVVLRILLGLAFAALVVAQAVALPLSFAEWAEESPDLAHLRWPMLAIAILTLLCVEVVIVCTWRLLTMVKEDRIFSEGSFVWVHAILGAFGAAWVLLLGAFVYFLAAGELPAVQAALLLALVALAVLGLLMVVMRALLRQATTLRTDMEAVI